MTVNAWLEAAHREAERRELPDLTTIFDGLAQAITALREADWNEDASGHPRHIDQRSDVR